MYRKHAFLACQSGFYLVHSQKQVVAPPARYKLCLPGTKFSGSLLTFSL